MIMLGRKDWRSNPWLFVPVWMSTLLVFWGPVKALVTLSLQDDRYAHLILIPLISIGLIFLDRERVFRNRRRAPLLAVPLFVVAGILYSAARPWSLSAGNDQLWLSALAIVLVWTATFVLLNGPSSASAALFPLCFLLLVIPLPAPFLDRCVYGLQKGSAELTHFMFKILGVPVLRRDFTFSLPGVDIEIAKECSGIRSSTALLITGILASHLFLRSNWKKLGFVLFTIPVALIKNAVRIVTLSLLGVYVNRGFLDSPLHHRGGSLFALVGLVILFPALLLLRKSEAGREPTALSAGELSAPLPLP
jgi:exosortase